VGHVAPADHAVELRRVYAVLESLPAEVRVALVLHRVDGMSLEDVAKAMNLSLATVKRRIAAARSALSEVVEES
jgi:RNA polymerase sigma-70 factor (ECF subfamily)